MRAPGVAVLGLPGEGAALQQGPATGLGCCPQSQALRAAGFKKPLLLLLYCCYCFYYYYYYFSSFGPYNSTTLQSQQGKNCPVL